jgi:hypothetical protein
MSDPKSTLAAKLADLRQTLNDHRLCISSSSPARFPILNLPNELQAHVISYLGRQEAFEVMRTHADFAVIWNSLDTNQKKRRKFSSEGIATLEPWKRSVLVIEAFAKFSNIRSAILRWYIESDMQVTQLTLDTLLNISLKTQKIASSLEQLNEDVKYLVQNGADQKIVDKCLLRLKNAMDMKRLRDKMRLKRNLSRRETRGG